MQPIVFVVGSDSDLPQLEGAFQLLRELGLTFGVRVLSAHRTPRETAQFAEQAAGAGIKVLVAAAGMAAALPGVLAAHTELPVIGVPMEGSSLAGVDALYAIVQMPPGVPVACMGIGSPGAKNAALHAARILALGDTELAARLAQWVTKQADAVLRKDQEARQRFGQS